ncbi:hypothetical protein G7Z17_g536 [Cylindrodendrum hubeiense]|uniref:NAD(P)-binding domain-containing protein n=1 Tax=Cylindrodendrum hubeiense TaxID=595255 RepID=A0A9P5LM70_9HYPO|nr:hypothetical protein G7Z17_g536 [Cylindrodendrum hubeiense]
MTQKYAKDQPQGFINHVQKVAIVGAGGNIGRVFAEHILKTGVHAVTAINRESSNSPLANGIKRVVVDYDDQDSIVSALKGQDFLIITLSLAAPPGTHSKLLQAAAKAGVPYFMPNAHSINFNDSEILLQDIPIGRVVLGNVAEVEQRGMTSITLVSGFWYEYSLNVGNQTFGFDLKNRAATFYDNGKKAVNVSTWPQCGRAVAALLSLKVLPEDENDKSVTVSQFHNKSLYVTSFKVSQRDILKSVEVATGTTEKDWKITHQPSDVRYKEGMEELSEGDQFGFLKAMYARVFYPSGDADFEPHNKLLSLPEEDLQDATREAIKMALGH